MSTLWAVLNSPLAHRVGWVLLHSIWQGAIIGGTFELLRFSLRRRSANLKYLAGCFALLLLFALPIITFVHMSLGAASSDAVGSLRAVGERVAAASNVVNETFPGDVQSAPYSLAQLSTDLLGTLAPWLAVVWSLGVAFFSTKLTRSWRWVGKIRVLETEPLESVWMRRLDELRSRLGISRPVRLLKSALVEVPTVVGWLRPIILLPAASLAGLTPDQLEAILAHELAHVRRFDYLVNACQCLIETLMFYHPVVWWVSRCVREERENSCDDLVVELCGDRIAYARALATLEDSRAEVSAMAVAASGGSLLQRVRRLLGITNDGGPANVRQIGGLACLGPGLILIAVGISIFLRPNLYQAITTLSIARNPVVQRQSNNGDFQSDRASSSQPPLTGIKSPSLLRRVVDELKLTEKWSDRSSGRAGIQVAEAVTLLSGRIRVQPEADPSLVEIRVVDGNPEEAARIANAVATTYREHFLELGTHFAKDTVMALKSQLTEQEQRVLAAQSNVDQLRLKLQISDPYPSGTAGIPTLSLDVQRQVQAHLIALQATEASQDAQLKSLERLSRGDLRTAIQSALGTPDANLNSLFHELGLAEQSALNAQKDYGKDHPEYIAAERRVKELNDKIDKAVDGILLGLRFRLDEVKASVTELNQELKNAGSNDLAITEKTRPYYEAKKALAEQEQFKASLGMKIAAAQTDLMLPKYSPVVIEGQATAPRLPIAPDRVLATALVALGIALGLVGVVMLRGNRFE